MTRASKQPHEEKGDILRGLREVSVWLLRELDHGPRLVTEIKKGAEKRRIPHKVLLQAAQSLPIIRRPRELRGPWIWKLPERDDLVRVEYDCPLADCARSREGWMQFEKSRALFSVGIVRYLVRGRVWRARPDEERSRRLRLA